VALENDANIAAYGEYWMGAGKGAGLLICLTLGTGVGGGFIIDGKVFSGLRHYGAEPGHMIIKHGGLLCGCGMRGCLEAYVSATGIVNRTLAALKDDATSILHKIADKDDSTLESKDVYEAAVEGDTLARAIMEETGTLLGVGIINLAHLFNPDLVLVGGAVSRAGDMLLDPARREVEEYALRGIKDATTIKLAALGNDAGGIGAAGLILNA
jgi:glucokinase